MTAESNKWIEAVARLIKLTNEGKIQWHTAKGKYSTVGIENADAAFIAQYKKKTLRIYRFLFKAEAPPNLLSASAGVSIWDSYFSEKKYPYWEHRFILEFVNDEGQSLWKFPDMKPLMNDLYSSIQYMVAGVSDFLEDILKDE